jgi:hypothetical protein
MLWWEARRLPYNVLVGLMACVALPVFLVAISRSGELRAGDDAVEPLALFAAPILANVAYTFGWVTELAINGMFHSGARRVGPALLRAGLGVSAFVVVAPAFIWAVRLVLRG